LKRALAALAATFAGLAALLGYKSAPARRTTLAVTPQGATQPPTGPSATDPNAPPASAVPGGGDNSGGGGDNGGGDGSGQGVAPTTPPTAPATSAAPLPAGAKVVTGPDVPNQFGDVQVQLTISGGKITDVKALQLPFDRQRSAYISQVAGPLLRTEVLQVQSASIDIISGATYTSESYAQSVQAALDQARK